MLADGATNPSSRSRPTRRQRDAALQRRLSQGRAEAERLRALAEHLPAADRALIEAMYGDGLRSEAIAALRGTSASAVRRRIGRLVDRMERPEFAAVVTMARACPGERWDAARLVVVEGRSLREAARMLGVTLHEARKEVARARAMGEAARLVRRSA